METKERITNKAQDLFFRYGFKSVSMDDIAANAGVSKKTIYQFFSDKDALINEIFGIEIRQNEIRCELQQNQSNDAIHEVFLSLEDLNELLNRMNPLLMHELEKYYPATHQKFLSHKNKFFLEIIKNNLQRGIIEGLYKPDINIDILSKFRISSVFLVFNNDIFPHEKYSLIQIIQEITYNFLNGISTPQGQKLILKYKSKSINHALI